MRERASATVAFMFGVGSRDESDSDAGLAHFIEHIVFKGGRRYPTARILSEAIEAVGGVLNASTDREATLFWAKVPSARLEIAIDVLSDMLRHPALDSTEVTKERQVVVEEIRMYADSPQDHVQTLFDEVMWPAHPLGRDIAGTEATVNTFDRDACARHLAAHYRPESLVVSVAGAIDDVAIERYLSERLGDWPVADAPPAAIPASDPTGPILLLQNRRTEQANIVIGARAPGYLDADRHSIEVLNTVLGEGMSSRLFLELREEQALAYDVSSYTTKLRDSGALSISLGCEPAKSVAAIRGAVAELHKLAERPLGAAELDKAREYTSARLLLQLESTSALCQYYGQQELLTGQVSEPTDLVAELNAVDQDDIQRVACAILEAPGGLRAAVVGPFRGSTRLEQALAV